MAKQYRAAVIGRTGRGNYGHNLDLACKSHPRMQIIAVADENPDGLKKAGERLGTSALYADWRQMLAKQRPEIVVIAMRWIDCHEEMALAAAEAGASIFMEKPMAPALAACDRMIDACDRTHTRMVLAYNMRACPIMDFAERKVREGLIGEVLELRARGKEDRRAGGEDMMVLGTHLFDILRRFAGDPQWAFGRITTGGKEITRADVNPNGPEGMGAIAGDAIAGAYGFPNGLTAYFASRKSGETSGTRWGVDLVGTGGILRIKTAHVPELWVSGAHPQKDPQWRRLEPPAGTKPGNELEANQLLIDDLLDAIEQRREPQSGGRTARWTIEMAHGLYASQRSGGRVRLPLEKREHPLLG
jgi:predicted dehydrogenase